MNETRLQQLEIENAKLAISLEHLSESVRELTRTVQELRDTMNRGRGALWVIVGASTLVGGAISAGVNKLLGH